MCRWLAYTGSPIPLDTFLYRPKHSLIDQSQHSEIGRRDDQRRRFRHRLVSDRPGREPHARHVPRHPAGVE